MVKEFHLHVCPGRGHEAAKAQETDPTFIIMFRNVPNVLYGGYSCEFENCEGTGKCQGYDYPMTRVCHSCEMAPESPLQVHTYQFTRADLNLSFRGQFECTSAEEAEKMMQAARQQLQMPKRWTVERL